MREVKGNKVEEYSQTSLIQTAQQVFKLRQLLRHKAIAIITLFYVVSVPEWVDTL